MSTGVWTVCCQAGCCYGISWWCPGNNISDRLKSYPSQSVSTGVRTVCCQASCCYGISRWCPGNNISDRKKSYPSQSVSTGVWTVSCQTGCCCGSSWWCPCIIYLTGLNHILASLCPQVYGLYLVKLAVAVVLAGGVHV